MSHKHTFFLDNKHLRNLGRVLNFLMKRGFKNVILGAVLVGFCGGVYAWTTVRVRATDLFAPVANELDEARAIKSGAAAVVASAAGAQPKQLK